MEIAFSKGVPVALDGLKMDGPALIEALNVKAGKHGVGRIDMLEDRLVGFKSREVYECPAAITLISAHRALETLTLDKKVIAAKKELEVKFSELAYEGYWFSPLKDAINSFIETTQEYVTGIVKVRLYKGQAVVRGMKSVDSIYSHNLATYSEGDAFDHSAAVGFIKIWGLPIKTWRQVHESKEAIEIPAQ